MMMIRTTMFGVTVVLALAGPAASAHISIHAHHISASGNDAVISVDGSSSCAPPGATADCSGRDIVVRLAPLPPGIACPAAPQPWRVTVSTSDLPLGNYGVAVRWDETELGTFSFEWPLANVTNVVDTGFTPAEGMWWSSFAPGTGMAFNMDDDGRWFGALYLLRRSRCTDLPDDARRDLTYDLDAPPRRPYAVGVSTLIHSEGGQCLLCPWRQAETSDTGVEAVLAFYSRNRATLTVGGGWRLDLTPLPVTYDEVMNMRALPLHDRHYLLLIDDGETRHVATVRAEQPEVTVGGLPVAIFHCVDCRSVDETGEASEGLDTALREMVEEQLSFSCIDNACRGNLDGRSGVSYIDKAGSAITAMLYDYDAPDSTTTRVELRLLPENWRD